MERKRPRGKEDEDDDGIEQGSLYLQSFLKYDTDELVAAGMEDVKVIAILETFCSKLKGSLATVKKTLADKEKEPKQEIRKQIVTEKRCFQCKAKGKALNPCVGYKHGGGESGDGVIFCNDCRDKLQLVTHSCTLCRGFFHNELGKDSCCGVNCRDLCYTCKSCKQIWCLPCIEDSDADAHLGLTCDNCLDTWYCTDCADDFITTERCGICNEEEISCTDSGCKTFLKCEGDCEEPVCDNCVCRLDWGNDARLCGQCEYECCDCDMCL